MNEEQETGNDAELAARGFTTTRVWTRGVDRKQFYPRPESDLGLPRPVFICVGRVAPEKNLEAFLSLDLPGTKLIVGDGPELESPPPKEKKTGGAQNQSIDLRRLLREQGIAFRDSPASSQFPVKLNVQCPFDERHIGKDAFVAQF